jgi:large subunit ribosomal protein L21
MYAIVLDRNKQYLVKENSIFKVDFLNAKLDSFLDFNNILFFNDGINCVLGTPFVENKIVRVQVINHVKDDKKIVLKFRRRKHHMKRIGHRQVCTVLRVIFIGDK